MPNTMDTNGDESLDLEIIPDSETSVDTQDTDEGEGEFIGDSQLNLETDEQKVDKLTPAEENARKQEEVWLNKVLSGKSVVEDAPSWLQKRLNSRLEATTKAPAIEDVVKQALQKEREETQFQEELKTVGQLTSQQAKDFNARYAELKPLGKLKAIQLTKEYMGLSGKTKEAEQRGIAKGKMSLPKSGQPSVRTSEKLVGNVPLSVVQSEKAWNEMVRTQR